MNKLAKLSKALTYKPEDLANGAAGLLEEVQTNKVSGEEEAFSHIDLVDFAGNVEGAAAGVRLPQARASPRSIRRSPGHDRSALRRGEHDAQRLPGPPRLGGYRLYTAQLKKTDANKLSQTVQALQDSLANLAEKVATA